MWTNNLDLFVLTCCWWSLKSKLQKWYLGIILLDSDQFLLRQKTLECLESFAITDYYRVPMLKTNLSFSLFPWLIPIGCLHFSHQCPSLIWDFVFRWWPCGNPCFVSSKCCRCSKTNLGRKVMVFWIRRVFSMHI